jgi:hypothetical protein
LPLAQQIWQFWAVPTQLQMTRSPALLFSV